MPDRDLDDDAWLPLFALIKEWGDTDTLPHVNPMYIDGVYVGDRMDWVAACDIMSQSGI